jgi:hypothetical protein
MISQVSLRFSAKKGRQTYLQIPAPCPKWHGIYNLTQNPKSPNFNQSAVGTGAPAPAQKSDQDVERDPFGIPTLTDGFGRGGVGVAGESLGLAVRGRCVSERRDRAILNRMSPMSSGFIVWILTLTLGFCRERQGQEGKAAEDVKNANEQHSD